jgi:hemolysin III
MEITSDRLCLGRMQNPVRGFMHGAAALLSIVGAVVLLDRAAGGQPGAGDLGLRVALGIFGVSLVALYTVSSLYHSVPWRSVWKCRMQRADHSMIYVVVAATYTPIAMAVCDGWLCTAALVATWGIAAVGIAQKIFRPEVGSWFSVSMQTLQGWLALPFLGMLARQMPIGAFVLVVAGGVADTVGMVFFVRHRPRLWPRVFSYHELFHVCVVTGSALHYSAILTYVAS